MNYPDFLDRKVHVGCEHGFDPVFVPEFLFPFQRSLVEWSVRKGRAAIFADCGLGKTPIQLTWAQNVFQKTGKPVLILTPLSVAAQTVREAAKFGIDAEQSRDGSIKSSIVVTNYQRLHYFDCEKFSGVVADESGVLKNESGQTRNAVVDFMRKMPYRLLCTATPSPNDFIELGNSSEALGELGFMDMISRFFKKSGNTTSRSDEFRDGVWRFRGHAERDFWRWVCSWARACRKPSDLGFDDGGFQLPPLATREHVIKASRMRDGFLLEMPAVTNREQQEERRRTIKERCEKAASLIADTGKPAIAWCHLLDEGHLLKKLIPEAVEVEGGDEDEFKEEMFDAFSRGQFRVLVTKPIIAGLGLNFQHCAHQSFFPSHSFEQWYQAVRRSWRFGQKSDVTIDIVSSEGERGVLNNLKRKADSADRMFQNLVELINEELRVRRIDKHNKQQQLPAWLS